MRLGSRLGAVAAAAVLLIGAAGCGGSDKKADKPKADNGKAFASQTAEEIKTQTIADMRDLSSLRISGDIGTGDQAMGIDLALDTSGTCAGTMEIRGGTAQIMQVNGNTYLKGDDAFWNASSGAGAAAQIQKTLGDKWAKLPEEQGAFGAICDLDQLLDEFDKPAEAAKDPQVGDLVDLDGQPAVQLITEENNGGTTTAWVAAVGDHNLLRIERVGGDNPGTIKMSDFDTPVEATEPTSDEYVDMSSLG